MEGVCLPAPLGPRRCCRKEPVSGAESPRSVPCTQLLSSHGKGSPGMHVARPRADERPLQLTHLGSHLEDNRRVTAQRTLVSLEE